VLELRRPTAGDVPALTAILAEPEVARWWGRFDADRVRAELVDAPGDGEVGWVVVVDGATAGWVQAFVEDDPDYRHVALDLFLTTPLHGRGLGREVIRRVVGEFAAQGHHRFTIDPAVANERAIRAYAAVGFRPVGVMRRYERSPEGQWRDALLMDLLVEELADPAPE
jgi:aminoglycoside 6'-N-acetyltransferase